MAKRQVMVIGESPSLNPRARSIFMSAMESAGFPEGSFRWIDVLDEAPPEGKSVTKTMIKGAMPKLHSRIESKDPSYVVLLGNTPCQAYLQQTGIKRLRGKPISHEGRVVLPVLHPHQVLHDDKWIDLIENDLRRLRECVDFGGIPEERELDYHVVDTWDKVKAMWADLRGKVSIDLETTRLYPFYTRMDELVESGRASKEALADHRATHGSNNMPKVVAMQFGCRKRQWVVPMETAGIWTRKQLEKIVRGCTRRLRKCIKIFHNGKFDCLWMRARFGVKWRVDFDTMLAHYMIDENDFHGLKYLAQKYLGAPDWDVDGKEKTSWSMKNAKYAAHDIFYTRKLYFILNKELKQDHDVKRVYDLVMVPCIKMFIEAEFKGVYIDLDKMDDAEAYLREEVSTALKNLEGWGKKAVKVDAKGPNKGKINWGSADQLADLLFNVLKIKPIEQTKGGKNSVSESVLLRIDHPMVGDLLKYRAASKQLSSFIEGWRPYIDLDGFLHPSFKLHGTVTGRLSCENPNLQQVPRDPRIRTLITAPEGWTLIEMDLSQIELRIAAELANEYNLLKVFNEGGDPHWQTAIREIERGAGYKKEILKTAEAHHSMVGKDYVKMNYSEAVEYILNIGGDAAVDAVKHWVETKRLNEAFMDWKETRKKAKAINFGYLYGMWWKKFKIYARDNYQVDVTDDEAQASREAFFELYPGFPAWHEKQRRFAQVNGYVRSLSGRKRRLPSAMGGRDTPERREAQRQAINSPVQSFANELNLMAALQMRREFSRSWFHISGTVHDAVLMLVRNDKVEHVFKRGLEIMSHPDLLDDFEIKMGVPIEAEAKIGPWGAGKDIKKWLESSKTGSAPEVEKEKSRASKNSRSRDNSDRDSSASRTRSTGT
jgi:DNA polymerase I-like protein with 3'-5' exonuclease and polymerase domains